MSAGAWMLGLAALVTFGALAFLIWSLIRSIQDERTRERGIWREFGLSLALMILFFATWIAHGITEWQRYTDEQHYHGQPSYAVDFFGEFLQSSLENWQSEFLQLFSFVTLAALYIHKGSGESKDGDDNVHASLRRIEEHLGTLPADAPDGPGEDYKLPDTALKAHDAFEARRR